MNPVEQQVRTALEEHGIRAQLYRACDRDVWHKTSIMIECGVLEKLDFQLFNPLKWALFDDKRYDTTP